ncbi:hypothetical protein, partial [Enterobacter hormaechei]|uniref:hypothetical protein n=1 Tax=Enterobacter hormaechei TaxID=158836 RepID=UPI001BCAAAB9
TKGRALCAGPDQHLCNQSREQGEKTALSIYLMNIKIEIYKDNILSISNFIFSIFSRNLN